VALSRVGAEGFRRGLGDLSDLLLELDDLHQSALSGLLRDVRIEPERVDGVSGAAPNSWAGASASSSTALTSPISPTPWSGLAWKADAVYE
jgi:hypothetical protein